MRTVTSVWQFLAGDTRSAPIGVAIAILLALGLERAHAQAWLLPIAFTAIIACALAAALAESA